MRRLRVAACQINTTIGDLDGNVAKIIEALEDAEAAANDQAAALDAVHDDRRHEIADDVLRAGL